MGCTHPSILMERIYENGEVVGIRCQSCGSVAFKGDSLWTLIKRNLLGIRRRA